MSNIEVIEVKEEEEAKLCIMEDQNLCLRQKTESVSVCSVLYATGTCML